MSADSSIFFWLSFDWFFLPLKHRVTKWLVLPQTAKSPIQFLAKGLGFERRRVNMFEGRRVWVRRMKVMRFLEFLVLGIHWFVPWLILNHVHLSFISDLVLELSLYWSSIRISFRAWTRVSSYCLWRRFPATVFNLGRYTSNQPRYQYLFKTIREVQNFTGYNFWPMWADISPRGRYIGWYPRWIYPIYQHISTNASEELLQKISIPYESMTLNLF